MEDFGVSQKNWKYLFLIIITILLSACVTNENNSSESPEYETRYNKVVNSNHSHQKCKYNALKKKTQFSKPNSNKRLATPPNKNEDIYRTYERKTNIYDIKPGTDEPPPG